MKILENQVFRKYFCCLRNIAKATLPVLTYEFLDVLSIHGSTSRRAPCSHFTAAVFITYLLPVVVVHLGIRSSLLYILPVLSARHFQYR